MLASTSKHKRKLVIGNWKMHGSREANALLLDGVVTAVERLPAQVGIGVCVPFPYLQQAADALRGSNVAWGAQDASAHRQGAYTGEVAAPMIADFGATLVIVGHSERRAYHGESSLLVATKTARVLEAGLTPVVCIGETLEQRDAGHTQAVVAEQLQAVLTTLSATDTARIVIAYEPVWAIGTGRSASALQAREVHGLLREMLLAKAPEGALVPLLYGGSVKPDNATELFSQQDIDGGLIGGAALKAADFASICASAAAALSDAGDLAS